MSATNEFIQTLTVCVLKMEWCEAIPKITKGYPILKIKIIEKDKIPAKVSAKIVHIHVPEERRFKKNNLRRRFHVPTKYPFGYHDKSLLSSQMHSGTSSKSSLISPMSSFYSPTLFFTQLPLNYFSPGFFDNSYLKFQSQMNNNNNVLGKTLNQPSKEYFKKEVNENIKNDSPYHNKFPKKYKKHIMMKNTPIKQNDVKNTVLDKPNYTQDTKFPYEPENFLHFMSSKEYFLPKTEPNYKVIDELTSKGVFLKEPRPTLSYLPLSEQAVAEKLVQNPPSPLTPSPQFNSFGYPKQLQTFEFHRFDLKPFYQKNESRYYDDSRLKPERFEFTEKDAVTPKQNIHSTFDSKPVTEFNTELSSVTPFRLIVEEPTTMSTEYSDESLKSD